MNKKSTMIFIVMLLAASAAGLVLLKYYGQEQPKPDESDNATLPDAKVNDSCASLSGVEKAKCYLDGGDLNKSVEACGNVSTMNVNDCIGMLALEYGKKDIDAGIELCSTLSKGSDVHLFCYTGIAGIIAGMNETGRTELIEKIKGICLNTSSPEICGSNAARILAYNSVDDAEYLCTVEMGGGLKSCYISVAGVAVKYNLSKALFVCSKSPQPDVRNSCYNSVAKVTAEVNVTKALDICSMSDYACYFDVANVVAPNDVDMAFSICGNMSRFFDRCYSSIANIAVSENPDKSRAICGHVSDLYERVDCNRSIAKVIARTDVNKALDICNSTGDYCYSDVAISVAEFNKTMSREICSSIKNDYARNRCAPAAA